MSGKRRFSSDDEIVPDSQECNQRARWEIVPDSQEEAIDPPADALRRQPYKVHRGRFWSSTRRVPWRAARALKKTW